MMIGSKRHNEMEKIWQKKIRYLCQLANRNEIARQVWCMKYIIEDYRIRNSNIPLLRQRLRKIHLQCKL